MSVKRRLRQTNQPDSGLIRITRRDLLFVIRHSNIGNTECLTLTLRNCFKNKSHCYTHTRPLPSRTIDPPVRSANSKLSAYFLPRSGAYIHL